MKNLIKKFAVGIVTVAVSLTLFASAASATTFKYINRSDRSLIKTVVVDDGMDTIVYVLIG